MRNDNIHNGEKTPCFFICHYKPNIERRKYLFENFVDSQKSIRWITEYDQEEIHPILDRYYNFSEHSYFQMIAPQVHILLGHSWGLANPKISWGDCFRYAQNWLEQQDNNLRDVLPKGLMPKKLSAGEVSLYLKHRTAWEFIVNSGIDYGCVLEDDFMVNENSLKRLNDLIACLPKDWDYVDIAGGAGLHIREEIPILSDLYPIIPPRGRTACGYLISRKLCEGILKLNAPITLVIDWQINYLLLTLNAKVFWTEPALFIHGSETGNCPSNFR